MTAQAEGQDARRAEMRWGVPLGYRGKWMHPQLCSMGLVPTARDSNYLTPPDPITSFGFPGGLMSLALWCDCTFGAESNLSGVWGRDSQASVLAREDRGLGVILELLGRACGK